MKHRDFFHATTIMPDEVLYAMALTRLSAFNGAQVKMLYDRLGSATAVYEHRHDVAEVLPDAAPRLVEALSRWDDALQRADKERQWLERNRLLALTPADAAYPQRMADCPDAPLVVYYRGGANLNPRHCVSVVGTRRCTAYGGDLAEAFCRDLSQLCPDALVVSGLAYGIDIATHRAALRHGLNTVGVLAHGLDLLYPARHTETARQMVAQGGLLTEYMSGTKMDKLNFVRRNRIVAGMSDATVVVESAAHGGSLITASIAGDYHREVVAFPGPVGAPASEGCNALVRDQKAHLVTSAEDLVELMGWQGEPAMATARRKGFERELFPALTPEQGAVVSALQRDNDLQLNLLSVKTNLPTGRLSALMFELEVLGLVRPMAGGTYHLIG